MSERPPAIAETSLLISSDKVTGTAVYNDLGEKFGKIISFMVNKRSGQVEYAVMSFGGFLGMGEDHYPLPWRKLKYDVEKGGFVVDIDQIMLDKAPKSSPGKDPAFDLNYGTMINSYYGITW
jgi:PRC-barrel domain